ncbi:bifunctional DNA-formamidopyrimidine glycosylase/DNA-(apurinic or apyrimidinic site) lyase [Frigidibacter sp. SD6-1]|uniref:bifunctional DNA-formamidopyrimidine glycosylase/DNA-(apurinic or apyrimidinic site) lyase n=1 Tax=Frigidibacter sp. SD6-1 TaxID=3032581 RepID=UPI0024E01BBF|nr:bifunctional DNA-formamidopyrimidine glycosylase/DNA-(apurinic or apyrimidinic site) lyase [Frigidibacter sp. SD6-1]
MPELPEVETVRMGLLPVMEGRVIARAQVNRPDLRFPLPARMAERLTGARVEGLRRRSKYILADLSTGETLLIHLGMSGRMLVSAPPTLSLPTRGREAPETTAQVRGPLPLAGREGVGGFHFSHPAPEKHDHVVLDMEGGVRITFNDARRFGAMDLMPTAGAEAHRLLRDLGPEPLGNLFNETYLAGRLAGRAMPVKAALLDQKIVAGLGNIYVSEALHRAGIDPRRLSGDLGAADVARLVPVVREVLSEAIAAGGSSLRDYRQADGELGYFQHSFRVYDREGQPCPAPGCTGAIERIVQSGRSTYHCPVCQT